MSGRRQLSVAVLLCLAGAAVVLLAVGRAWTQVEVPAGPLADARTVAVTGTDLAPGVRALGLVGLAGVVALLATRTTGRLVVGGLLAAAGVGVVASVLGTDLTGASLREAGVPGAAVPVGSTAWPAVAALGGGVLSLVGIVAVLRGRSWPAMGARYEAPAPGAAAVSAPAPAPTAPAPTAPAPTAPAPHAGATGQPERALWEALDRGEDPTDTLEDASGTRPRREGDRT